MILNECFATMKVNDLKDNYWWWDTPVSSLNLASPLTVSPDVPVQEAIEIMKRKGFDQMPVVDKDGYAAYY